MPQRHADLHQRLDALLRYGEQVVVEPQPRGERHDNNTRRPAVLEPAEFFALGDPVPGLLGPADRADKHGADGDEGNGDGGAEADVGVDEHHGALVEREDVEVFVDCLRVDGYVSVQAERIQQPKAIG